MYLAESLRYNKRIEEIRYCNQHPGEKTIMEETKNITTDWESLGLSNDFLFGKIMQNPELCKEMLHRIFPDLQIDHIEYPELQKSIKPDVDAKSIRLDVYVKDNQNTVYDIEIQMSDTRELPKRTRYYQSLIDLQLLDKGIDYKYLKKSFIIFICLFDLFKKGRHIYTFQNTCQEDTSITLNDESYKIFLNTESTMNDVKKELSVFLDYIVGKETEDDIYIRKLMEAVKEAKKNREWRHEYMTLLMRDQENIEKGREQGIEQGREQEREQMIVNALTTTKSIKQTAFVLCLDEQTVRKIAETKNIPVND